MSNNNISKAIRSILSQNETVTVKQVLEALETEHSITAEYRPVFGALRRITTQVSKGVFNGLSEGSIAVMEAPEEMIIETAPSEGVTIEETTLDGEVIEEVTIAVEDEAPKKKAARRKRKK